LVAAVRVRRRARRLAALAVALLAGVAILPSARAEGTGSFAPTGACVVSGCGAAGVLLPNGKVLAMDVGAAGAQLYDPATGTWAPTGACEHCPTGSVSLTVTLLPSGPPSVCGPNCGKVLVAGGLGPAGILGPPSSDAFLYDPTTGTWAQTGSMTVARVNHSATLLPDGRVLVAGGCITTYHGCAFTGGGGVSDPDTFTYSAELFNPLTGTWTRTGDMRSLRALHTATVLSSQVGGCGDDCGKVLVAGGVLFGGSLFGAELYDPATGTWSRTAPLTTARFAHSAVQLHNGRVLVVGTKDGEDAAGNPARAEVYDPVEQTWTPTSATMDYDDYLSRITLLPNGTVLAIGRQAQVYDPVADKWTLVPSLPQRLTRHIQVLLGPGPASVCGTNCGKVLAAGVTDTGSMSVLYTPPPQVTSVTPDSGPPEGGTQVLISGSGFTSATGVTFGGVPAAFWAVDASSPDTRIVAQTPAHVAAGAPVVVTSPAGSSAPAGASFAFGAATTTSTSSATATSSTTTTPATTTTIAMAAATPADALSSDPGPSAGSAGFAATPAPSAASGPVSADTPLRAVLSRTG